VGLIIVGYSELRLKFHIHLASQSIGFLLILLVAMSATASDVEKDIFAMSLEELINIKITTASKSSQNAHSAPSVVTVFTQRDIEMMGGNSLIDILKHAPGIETSMSPNGSWRVSMRGVRKDGIILLLVDGHPFNDFYDGQAQFDFPLASIKKIEIIRGPGSALYGTNAVAGVINVFTHNKESSAAVAVANNNGYQASVNYFDDSDERNLSLGLGILKTDGSNVTEGADFSSNSSVNSNFPTNTNRFVKEYYLSAKYSQQNFQLSAFGLDKKRGPWVGPSLVFGADTVVDKKQLFIKGSYRFEINPDLAITPQLFIDQVDLNSFNQDVVMGRIVLNNLFTDGGFTKEKYRAFNSGQEIAVEYNYDKSTRLLMGFEHSKLELTEYDLQRNYRVIGFVPQINFANFDQLLFEQKDQQREIYALYAQSEFMWKKVFLTLGLRYDDYSDFGSTLNPRVALVYNPVDRWTTKFLYGSAFRAPTFKELYDNTRIGVQGVSGNNQLQPEESKTLEFSVEYQNDAYILKSNLFHIDSENIIGTFDPNGGGQRGSIENLGSIRSKGIEIEGVYQANESLRLFVNYSSYRADFKWDDNPIFLPFSAYVSDRGNSQLFNQPRTRANVGITWQAFDWSVFVSANYGGRASHNNTTPLEGLRELLVDEYLQFNFNLNYYLDSGSTITLSASSLGKDKNSDPDGSSDSDTLGINGLLQPKNEFRLSYRYKF